MRPYLKAEMMYGLRVLLSIVEDINSGYLCREMSFKRLKEVKLAGDLTGNHLFAVGVLRGLIVPREYLTMPLISLTLCNTVRKCLFSGDTTMTKERIRKAVTMSSENLGIHVLGGEHALCEAVRAAKGNPPGTDAYHKDQDFVWKPTDSSVHDNILTEMHAGNKKPMKRSEDDDRKLLGELCRADGNEVKHRWWIPKPDRTECLVHFINECNLSGSNPMEVLHSSEKGRTSSGKKEELLLWRKYVSSKVHKINIGALPKVCEAASESASTRSDSLVVTPSYSITGEIAEIDSRQRKRKVGVNIEKRAKRRAKEGKNTFCISRDAKLGDTPEGIKNKQKTTSNINEMRRVHVNLGREARKGWKSRHGEDLPELFPFGDTFSNIGVVWTQSVHVANGDPLYTTYHYPPSVLDEYAISLPDSAGVAFPRKKMATNALYWWIICTIPIKQNRISWANGLLGEHESSLLVVNQQPWCTLSRDSVGSIWIEHKGNKFLLAS
jgi:hypothetical protein